MNAQLSSDARIAVLEERMEALEKAYEADMREVKIDLKTLITAFNEMTGGKKAIFALSAFTGGVLAALGTVAAILTAWPHHGK